MQSRRIHAGVTLALVVAAVVLGGATDAYAQRKMTRLGSPDTRFTAPIANAAGLKKTFAAKTHQADVAAVLDQAGLASLTPKVLAVLTAGEVTETSVAPGTPIRWMALRRGGKPSIVLDAVWAGTDALQGFRVHHRGRRKGLQLHCPEGLRQPRVARAVGKAAAGVRSI